MSYSTNELLLFITVLVIIFSLSNFLGFIFEKIKQPRVIGEILSGIFIGHTLLKNYFPDTFDYFFRDNPAVNYPIFAFKELGLLFLMFISGLELKRMKFLQNKNEIFILSGFGLLIPSISAFLILPYIDLSLIQGPKGDTEAISMIFIIATAVTSIPVISRILLDLNLLDTGFGRIVLSIALVEDLILYGLLNTLMGNHSHGNGSPLFFEYLGLPNQIKESYQFNILLTVLFFGFSFYFGPKILKIFIQIQKFLHPGSNALSLITIFFLSFISFAIFLGISPMFGALLAGIVFYDEKEKLKHTLDIIKKFSISTFIPLYFCIVGFQLDLINNLNIKLLLSFVFFSSFVKIFSIYSAGIFLKKSTGDSLILGIALNARGGPGIVLASITYSVGMINSEFYITLVLTAILTSLFAGTVLNKYRTRIALENG